MHELSITQSMLDIVLDQAKTADAKKVTKINLVIGELSGVVSDCVQFYFDFLKRVTPPRRQLSILSWYPLNCGVELARLSSTQTDRPGYVRIARVQALR